MPTLCCIVLVLTGSFAGAAGLPGAGSPTAGIQEAIDALPAGGGVVTLPPGRYVLRRAIVLRSHVTLRGERSHTVLTRGAQVHAKLTRPAKKGHTQVEVVSTAGLRAGDEVALLADGMHGWYMAHCIIKAVAPKRLIFTEPIASGHREGVFDPRAGGAVVNYFPFIRGSRTHDGKAVTDVTVDGLTIDSNLKANPGKWQDFTLAAIHFANVSDSVVSNCIVRGSVGDGIGVQGGRDVRVEGCLVENCRGHGLHPGTALRGAIFANNISRNNGGDGLFFCWQVVGITVRGNLLTGNAGSGVGGLGRGGTGGDRFNVVAGNVCRRNGRFGIEADGGNNNVIANNVCLDNSQSRPGHHSGIALIDTTQTVVSGNRCGCDEGKPTQKHGIEESGKSDHNSFTGNVCTGNAKAAIRVVGRDSRTAGNVDRVVRE